MKKTVIYIALSAVIPLIALLASGGVLYDKLWMLNLAAVAYWIVCLLSLLGSLMGIVFVGMEDSDVEAAQILAKAYYKGEQVFRKGVKYLTYLSSVATLVILASEGYTFTAVACGILWLLVLLVDYVTDQANVVKAMLKIKGLWKRLPDPEEWQAIWTVMHQKGETAEVITIR